MSSARPGRERLPAPQGRRGPGALLGELFASAPNGNVTASAATSSKRPPIPKRETLRRSPKPLAGCRSSIYYLLLVPVGFRTTLTT